MTAGIEYTAGFFDGEGSITLHMYFPRDGLPRPHVRVAISNYIKEPLVLIRRRWGGSLSEGKAGVWGLSLNGEDAYRFLLDVFPYLIVKREAAHAALRLFERQHDPVQRLQWAKAIMDATRKGYRAARRDTTYNLICRALESLNESNQG